MVPKNPLYLNYLPNSLRAYNPNFTLEVEAGSGKDTRGLQTRTLSKFLKFTILLRKIFALNSYTVSERHILGGKRVEYFLGFFVVVWTFWILFLMCLPSILIALVFSEVTNFRIKKLELPIVFGFSRNLLIILLFIWVFSIFFHWTYIINPIELIIPFFTLSSIFCWHFLMTNPNRWDFMKTFFIVSVNFTAYIFGTTIFPTFHVNTIGLVSIVFAIFCLILTLELYASVILKYIKPLKSFLLWLLIVFSGINIQWNHPKPYDNLNSG